MAYSQAQNKASQKYRAANVKRIPLDVPIEEYNQFKQAADKRKEKINTILRQAMKDYVSRWKD